MFGLLMDMYIEVVADTKPYSSFTILSSAPETVGISIHLESKVIL